MAETPQPPRFYTYEAHSETGFGAAVKELSQTVGIIRSAYGDCLQDHIDHLQAAAHAFNTAWTERRVVNQEVILDHALDPEKIGDSQTVDMEQGPIAATYDGIRVTPYSSTGGYECDDVDISHVFRSLPDPFGTIYPGTTLYLPLDMPDFRTVDVQRFTTPDFDDDIYLDDKRITGMSAPKEIAAAFERVCESSSRSVAKVGKNIEWFLAAMNKPFYPQPVPLVVTAAADIMFWTDKGMTMFEARDFDATSFLIESHGYDVISRYGTDGTPTPGKQLAMIGSFYRKDLHQHIVIHIPVKKITGFRRFVRPLSGRHGSVVSEASDLPGHTDRSE